MALFLVYTAGALLTALSAAPVTAAVGAAAPGAAAAMSAVGIGLAWPVTAPLLTTAGVAQALTPRAPGKRDLVALDGAVMPVDQRLECRVWPVPVEDVQKAGGYHEFASGEFPLLQAGSSLMEVLQVGRVESRTNWRGGSVFYDTSDAIPRVTADWVGNETGKDGEEIANLRVCSLQAAGGEK